MTPAPARALHRSLPWYAPTPLRSAPALAARIGAGTVLVKDESERFGQRSFKVLGASWAAHVALCASVGRDPRSTTVDGLRQGLRAAAIRPSLLAASAGNHGLALTWFANQLQLRCRILLPIATHPDQVAAIAAAGAEVEIVDGTYDDAVREAAGRADAECLLISDTAWPGYEDVPAAVVDGYATMLEEIDDELRRGLVARPTHVVVPVGVGALATAVVRRARGWAPAPDVLSVEPASAACLAASVAADARVAVAADRPTVLAGLNCGELSLLAWPELRGAIRTCLTVEDEAVEVGLAALAEDGIVSGPCGGAGAGALLTTPVALTADDCVLLFATEGRLAEPRP